MSQNQHLNPLMIASGKGDTSEVERLLKNGASPFLLDSITGTSPLHFAAQGGNTETARVLIDAGALINLQAASYSFTPLMVAVWYRNVDMVKFLLAQERINPLIKNIFGGTAYEFIDTKSGKALQKEEKEIIDIFDNYFKKRNAFIQHHFENDETTPKADTDINTRIPNGDKGNDYYTSILVAARDGNTELFKKLIEKGADILVTDEYFRANIAHKAAYIGHPDILKIICTHSDFDKIKNKQGPTNGYTPLHDAVWHGHYDAVKVLLNLGVEKELKGWDNLTPIELARKNNYQKIIELLE